MKFNDPYNPTADEIKIWANDKNSFEPEQDWDIIVNWLEYPDLILKLATEDNCPTQNYFIHILYVIIGDFVRSNRHRSEEIDVLFNKAKNYDHQNIKIWIERSRYIMKYPKKFKYGDWFSGNLSKNISRNI